MKDDRIYFRVSPDERKQIEDTAYSLGLSVSEYVRGLALDSLHIENDLDEGVYRMVTTTSIIKIGKDEGIVARSEPPK